MFVHSFLGLLIVVTFVQADINNPCLEPVQQYIFCMKQEARYWPTLLTEEISDGYRKKVDQCFTKCKCEAPANLPLDYNLTSVEKQVWNKFRTWWDPLSLAKKHCVINTLSLNFRPKLTSCISQQLPGFSVPSLPDDQSLTPEMLTNIKKLAEFRVMIERSTYYCKAHQLEVDVCIYELRRKSFVDTCKIRRACLIDRSPGCVSPCYTMSDQCVDFVKTMRPKACKCATDAQKLNRQLLTSIEDRSDDILHGLLFHEHKNKIAKAVSLCGGGLPEQAESDLEAQMSNVMNLRVTEYIDGFGERDVTFCHTCPDQDV